MSWQHVANKDFRDSLRSRKFWSIITVSLLFLAIVAFGAGTGDTGDTGQEIIYQLFNTIGSQLVVPVMAIIVGYMAVAGERQSGSLRVLFGLTHGRRDVVFGKLVSRVLLMVIGMILAAFVVAGLVLALFDSLNVSYFLGFAGLTILLAVCFTGIAVGISAAVGSRARAMGAAVGTYVAFMIFWYPAVAILHFVINGELAGVNPPDWYLGLLMANPLLAYNEALGQLLGQYLTGFVGWPFIVEDVPQDLLATDSALLFANRAGGETPFFLTEWFGVAVLLAWFVIPLLIGYWRFKRADLN